MAQIDHHDNGSISGLYQSGAALKTFDYSNPSLREERQ